MNWLKLSVVVRVVGLIVIFNVQVFDLFVYSNGGCFLLCEFCGWGSVWYFHLGKIWDYIFYVDFFFIKICFGIAV